MTMTHTNITQCLSEFNTERKDNASRTLADVVIGIVCVTISAAEMRMTRSNKNKREEETRRCEER